MPIRPVPAKAAIYNARLNRAGAIVAETRTLLRAWNVDESVACNEKRLKRENALGTVSGARFGNIWSAFEARYLRSDLESEAGSVPALVQLQGAGWPSATLVRLFWWHIARAEPLLRAVFLDHLVCLRSAGVNNLTPSMAASAVREQLRKTGEEWGTETIERYSQAVLSTLRDLEILQGKGKKSWAPYFLPVEAFAFLAFALHLEVPSGAGLLSHPDWELFFLTVHDVEALFVEAHTRHLLEYHAAGSIVRLSFPSSNLSNYAMVLAAS